MISHEHRLIFIHIPKCAGTSVERFFGHWENFSGRDGQDHRPMRMLEPSPALADAFSNKENAKLFLKRYRHSLRHHANPKNGLSLTPEQFKNYYKFTIVRDPWSRVLSWFQNVKNDPKHLDDYGIAADIAFDDFVARFAGKGMLAPAEYWLSTFDGAIELDREIDFAHLRQGFSALAEDLGLSETKLGHHHSGKTKTRVEDIYSDRARNIIADRYAKEIARYGFEFGEDKKPDRTSNQIENDAVPA